MEPKFPGGAVGQQVYTKSLSRLRSPAVDAADSAAVLEFLKQADSASWTVKPTALNHVAGTTREDVEFRKILDHIASGSSDEDRIIDLVVNSGAGDVSAGPGKFDGDVRFTANISRRTSFFAGPPRINPGYQSVVGVITPAGKVFVFHAGPGTGAWH